MPARRAQSSASAGRTRKTRRVGCPALVLYGVDGAMARHYDVPATWADRLENMRARAMPGGHFFVDLHPEETADALLDFLPAQAGAA